ncbi:MAG: ANTAR domain-containing protein, partial [Acetatifactor sp.]|nr:ANTAR domain-containing protein [Acetatifactor sp.]
ISTVNMMADNIVSRRRRQHLKARTRSAEEDALIRAAKELLMARNHMDEEEAHRYLQKCSMDSGTNLVETAQMVLAMMKF